MSILKTKCIKYNGVLLDGYGIVKLPKSTTTYKAHRLVWQLYKGKIPKGFQICHKCDNRACINVKHLFLGTATDNMRDMINKGRGIQPNTQGSKHGMSKLDEEKVKHIKEFLIKGNRIKLISELFGVSRQTISDIKSGRGWKHVK